MRGSGGCRPNTYLMKEDIDALCDEVDCDQRGEKRRAIISDGCRVRRKRVSRSTSVTGKSLTMGLTSTMLALPAPVRLPALGPLLAASAVNRNERREAISVTEALSITFRFGTTMVYDAVDIMDLMGGDDYGAFVGHVLDHRATESTLAGDIEAVCGLIHQKERLLQAKAKLMKAFLLCPIESLSRWRSVGNSNISRHRSSISVEAWIERRVDPDIFGKGH